ncbi:MAG: terminase small subunit [Oscillospiraceae bacterium]|jgi:phage terminase small subunit|nr:terminase small subunit [Oscillospiraceae bacterium]
MAVAQKPAKKSWKDGSARMWRFCEIYAADPEANATRAAKAAGYAAKNADSQACRLLKRSDVRAKIKELRADLVEQHGINRDSVILDLREVFRRCMQAQPVLEWDSEARDYIPSGEYRFDARGAIKAAELLARITGLMDGQQDGALPDVTISQDFGEVTPDA